MNGCRGIYNKPGFERIVDLGHGYSVRVGCYEVEIGATAFISALEVLMDHAPSDEELRVMEAAALEKVKRAKEAEVEEKASSPAVKRFLYGDKEIWWDSETRASIRASLEARSEGWYLDFDGDVVEYGTRAEALAVVDAVEVYASECHRAVCRMRGEIEALSGIEAAARYEVMFPGPVVVG